MDGGREVGRGEEGREEGGREGGRKGGGREGGGRGEGGREEGGRKRGGREGGREGGGKGEGGREEERRKGGGGGGRREEGGGGQGEVYVELTKVLLGLVSLVDCHEARLKDGNRRNMVRQDTKRASSRRYVHLLDRHVVIKSLRKRLYLEHTINSGLRTDHVSRGERERNDVFSVAVASSRRQPPATHSTTSKTQSPGSHFSA